MSILTSQLVFLLRWSRGQRRNLYLDQFTYSKYFRNFHTHTLHTHTLYFFFLKPSTEYVIHLQPVIPVYWIHMWNFNKDGKETRCLRGWTQWGAGGRAESVRKNSPERENRTFQRSKRCMYIKTFILFL